jgi:hypothetical protein
VLSRPFKQPLLADRDPTVGIRILNTLALSVFTIEVAISTPSPGNFQSIESGAASLRFNSCEITASYAQTTESIVANIIETYVQDAIPFIINKATEGTISFSSGTNTATSKRRHYIFSLTDIPS